MVAFALRAWQPGRMAIEHYDEGVYAANLFAAPPFLDYKYPDRHLYAPPFLPAVYEWVLILSGQSLAAVMWVNVLLGTALVAAIWWTTRELLAAFDSTLNDDSKKANRKQQDEERIAAESSSELAAIASMVAALLATFHDQLITYSRVALTDTPVTLWMTLAVGMGCRGLRSESWRWLLGAGLLTGLAWWTKYNGWLPLAILGAGIAGWGVWLRPGRRTFTRRLIGWGVIALCAFVVWLPYLRQLQSEGGYAAVAANHAGYVRGWSQWGSGLLRHLAIDRHVSQLATGCGFAIAAGWLVRFTWNDAKRNITGTLVPVSAGLLAGAATMLLGSVPMLLMLCVPTFGLATGMWERGSNLRERGPDDRKSKDSSRRGGNLALPGWSTAAESSLGMGMWILAAWLAGLLVATPLYTPYPRLILPWLTGLIIAGGIGGARLAFLVKARRNGSSEAGTSTEIVEGVSVPFWMAVLVPGAAIGVMVVDSFWPQSIWEDRRRLERVVDTVVETIQTDLSERTPSRVPGTDAVVYVLAEPGAFVYLAGDLELSLSLIAQPASNLGMLEPGNSDPRLPTYLLTGPHARDEAAKLAADSRVNRVAEFAYAPSELVLLDEFPPSELDAHRDATVQLWIMNR